jgi:hypothetical protein
MFLITWIVRLLPKQRYAWMGVCGGLLALCHPSCAFALPVALVVDVIRRGRAAIAPRAAIALAVCALVLAPWIVRNYLLTGRLIAGVDGFGYQYLVGSSVFKYGRPNGESLKPLFPPGHEKVRYATVDSVANAKLDAIAKQDLTDSVLHHPGNFIHRFSHQFVWFWLADKRDSSRRTLIGHLLYILPLFAGTFAALFLRWRSVGSLILIALPTIAIHCIVVAYAYEAMYSLPVIPVMVIMSAAIAEEVIAGVKTRSGRNRTKPRELAMANAAS